MTGEIVPVPLHLAQRVGNRGMIFNTSEERMGFFTEFTYRGYWQGWLDADPLVRFRGLTSEEMLIKCGRWLAEQEIKGNS